DLELEPPDRTETLNGRRRKHYDESVLDGVELRLELAGDGAAAKIRATPLVEGVQSQERDARAGAIDEAVDRQPRKLNRSTNPLFLEGDLGHFPNYPFGPV